MTPTATLPAALDQGRLLSMADTTDRILAGERLLVAGDEPLLAALPRGAWMGGTIPYFMTPDGGAFDTAQVFVTPLPAEVEGFDIVAYDRNRIERVAAEGPENGFTYLLIPSGSPVHQAFAELGSSYERALLHPVIGWITGVALDQLDRRTPKVFNGMDGTSSDQHALAMHVALPPGQFLHLDIINLFTQGDGATIVFEESGFSAQDALIDGERRNLAAYLTEQGIDTRQPLVADYYGAMVNVSFRAVDVQAGVVDFYAPVFAGQVYKVAAPVADYVRAFEDAVPQEAQPLFACNCILNYLYGELEGRATPVSGPVTFGEIAYQLLNQTFVYASLKG